MNNVKSLPHVHTQGRERSVYSAKGEILLKIKSIRRETSACLHGTTASQTALEATHRQIDGFFSQLS